MMEQQKIQEHFTLRSRTELVTGLVARHKRCAAATAIVFAERIAAEKRANAKIGDLMDDGTIYAGISPTTKERMYAEPVDIPLKASFSGAALYARALQVGDKNDFRVPDLAELQVLFENRNTGALQGTFEDDKGSPLYGWYWSSQASAGEEAYGKRFGNGLQEGHVRTFLSYVRCVR
jgi:hypothetical protein